METVTIEEALKVYDEEPSEMTAEPMSIDDALAILASNEESK